MPSITSTESAWALTIHWLEIVDSTQRYLSDALASGEMAPPCAVVADRQYAGQGSRGNAWTGMEGNLFLSFSLQRDMLPDDLKLESCSIYFAFLLKEVLREHGSKVWLKWPNDFYLLDKKIGGAITTLRQNTLICGIGLNLLSAPEAFGRLDIGISRKKLLDDYFELLEKMPSWKQIFRLYALEFEQSRRFETHHGTRTFSMKNARLCEDGSIECEGQRMYSQR